MNLRHALLDSLLWIILLTVELTCFLLFIWDFGILVFVGIRLVLVIAVIRFTL